MQNASTERWTRTSKPVTAQPHSYFNLRGGFTRESLKRSTLRNNSQVASLQYSWAGLMPVAKHPIGGVDAIGRAQVVALGALVARALARGDLGRVDLEAAHAVLVVEKARQLLGKLGLLKK